MASVNKVLLSGNLGATPELRFTPKGTPVVELRLAVNIRVKEGEAWVDRTDWYYVEAFGKQAEASARYLTKGSPILIDGALRVDTWTDVETDKKRSKIRIRADEITFLPRAKPDGYAPPPISEARTEITHINGEPDPAEPPF